MSFESLKYSIKESYRTPDNIVEDFYIPLLSNAKKYDRAVGFFSSSILIELSRGLINLIHNEGKMRLITSPKLQEQDIQAMKEGYDKRKIIEDAIMREWKEPKNYIEEERLNFLSHMIEDGFLDIKVAFKNLGMYHEKIGILTDEDGNSVAFSGSLNESEQAISLNFESIDAFTSWNEPSRTKTKIEYFEETWNNNTHSLEVIDFPKVAREKLQSYKKERYNENIDEIEKVFIKNNPPERIIENIKVEKSKNVPMLPEPTEKFKGLHKYQTDAIKEWKEKGFCGIFDMATGTGKTYTGLGALVELYNYCNSDLAVVICCPFIHLVEQWVEDLKKFNIEPIIGYSTSSQKDWKERLTKAINYHNYQITNKKFFCFITTNATFYSDFVQKELCELKGNSLLMVDEAHYFGAECIRKNLPEQFNYRLALSATIERHGDDEGTDAIFNYFGDKCIEYTIKMAMDAGQLTQYKYYPIPIYLTPEELSDYKMLSKEIAKYMVRGDKKHIPDAAKPYLLKRAKLIAGAKNKITTLEKIMLDYKDKKHILVFCGATTIEDSNANNNESLKQIELIGQLLGNKLKIKTGKFTAEETIKERQNIKKMFADGDMLQVLVAIKCLDEGFNIPEIETAFLLASTTNPKQYIQRRGRVLRLSEGKDFAEIYDFITLPRPLEDVVSLTECEQKYERGLVKNEFNRMQEFNKISMNRFANDDDFITKLIDVYNLYDEDNTYDTIL